MFTVCGLCGALCPALMVRHKEFTAEIGKVEGDVIWDEAKCNACKICVEACPTECHHRRTRSHLRQG